MEASIVLDIMYLEIGEKGPIWPDTNKISAGMELAAETGFKNVEFWDWNNVDWKTLIKKKDELGVHVVSTCAKDRGFLADPNQHEKAVQGLKETIPVAKALGCENISVTAMEMPGFSREESHKNILEGLRKLTKVAEQEKVTLILEPISGNMPPFYFKDSAEPFGMIEEIGSEHLKLLYDIYHYQMMEGNIVETIRANLDKIGHIHMANAPLRNEITDGELNYTYIIKSLKGMGYDKYIGVEFAPAMDRKTGASVCRKLIADALGEK